MSSSNQDEENLTVKRFSIAEHGIKATQLCPHTRKILKKFNKSNYEAYLVGGAVRDLLLGLEPKDFDIATAAHPEQIKRLFASCRLIGRRFRLAHIYFGRHYLEVATFRAPHDNSKSGKTSNDGRITHDNVYGTIEQDALRRDFTINALFYDQKTKKIIDYVDGVADIQTQHIRLIGNPETRYREDPVRMLRAIRFAVKLGFTIEPKTQAPIYELGHLLRNIAPARLFDEVLKLFHSGHALQIFKVLRHYNLFQYLFPLTETSLSTDDEGKFLKFIETALTNTDKRITQGKSITPAFLYAVMLWDNVQKRANEYLDEGQLNYQATQLAASDTFSQQVKYTAIPRRFSNVTREIWSLQNRFLRKDCRSAFSFTEHKRFRGAYDFHCLRTAAGEIEEKECEWWSQFQFTDHDEQMKMCQQFSPPKRKKKPHRNKKSS